MKTKLTILFLFFACIKQNSAQMIAGDSIGPSVFYQRLDSIALLPYHACTDVYKAIDITNDGIADLNMRHWNCASPAYQGAIHSVYILNHSIQLAVKQNAVMWPDTVSPGTTIDNALTWQYSTAEFILRSYSYGFMGNSQSGIFLGNSRFIGFRINNVNDTTYGWIRVGVNGANGLLGTVIRSYALGQSLISINKEPLNNIQLSIYPNPASSVIHIDQSDHIKKIDKLTLFDVYGEEHLIMMNDKNEIDVSELAEGVYFLRFKTSIGIGNQKIIVLH